MPNLRFILDTKRPGALNMGIDEAVLEGVIAETSPATLRFYGWEPDCLTIGYFQSLREEADLAKCQELGVDCIRRATGGGAVLHQYELTYSLIAPVGHYGIPEAILDSYRHICDGIIQSLKLMDVQADFVPLNDIIANGKKISGNAQTRRHGVVLQHGTILLDVDLEKMFSLLLIPDEKIKDKMIAGAKERVTGLKSILGREVGFAELAEHLQAGFAQVLQTELAPGQIGPHELNRAKRFAAEKYGADSWNFKR
ncbi:MAG TPA: lipoate--protein ligase family protein [Candidatus Wirthbacteria bacterium]|nr:lipoate--protein ligase family protein [Candidatus Wirthbacteria bacterium]